jgi:predicted nucleotidyltransferase
LDPDRGYPSATAVRAALAKESWDDAQAACGYNHRGLGCHLEKSLDLVQLCLLRSMSKAQLAALPDCTEGLQNRLYKACREAVCREELLNRLKTRRYTYARLSRLCCHGMLGVTERMLKENPLPTYVRLLGFRQEREGLLSLLRQSSILVVAKAADGPVDEDAYRLDEKAYDLWALGAGEAAGLMYRQGVVVRP